MSDKNMMAVIPKLSEEEKVFLCSNNLGPILVCSTSFPDPISLNVRHRTIPEVMLTKRSKIVEELSSYPDWFGEKPASIIKKIEETP